ncbi:hypothetical protein ACSSS7_004693 [Eimeria intestinalis]
MEARLVQSGLRFDEIAAKTAHLPRDSFPSTSETRGSTKRPWMLDAPLLQLLATGRNKLQQAAADCSKAVQDVAGSSTGSVRVFQQQSF